MGPAELVAPLQISPAWYVAVCFVLLIALSNLFAPLIRLAAENPQELCIVAIGPLTNVALAIAMDPGVAKAIKDLGIDPEKPSPQYA